ncbi:hypothetical protein H4R33_006211 [Dimargaris cristalligena]|uniref:RlpA-like double-psi beta-barrel-protein domain-containing protein-containing protein n=1 Tax=Dimargaris cristalligena TaxID=215637 RepID=A0A4Q0A185_9FUNG|nr:hypothetical protein H4R33_006211 [Dimargaris cristalligena]RKP39787.1 hypothetical protein BJ085DRAFT_33875 [Dimargaris cristalligena]|eukprot:RKP39787.1 hypothetical protein BJ085DRAFT_33875 [Dimargaris cristalligena]
MKFITIAVLAFSVLANASPIPNRGLFRRQEQPQVSNLTSNAPTEVQSAPVVTETVAPISPVPINLTTVIAAPNTIAPVTPTPVTTAPATGGIQPGTQVIGTASFDSPRPQTVGSCGPMDGLPVDVVAINGMQMNNGPNPNDNPLCHKTMTVQFEDKTSLTTKTVTVKVMDTCASCKLGEIVLSNTAAQKLGQAFMNQGRAQVSWLINQ